MLPGALSAAVAAAVEDAPSIVVKGIEKVPGRFLLVDGDYLAYYCAGGDHTTVGDARMRLMQRLDDMKTMAGAEHIALHLTATGSHKGWRYVIAQQRPYQAQREGSARPKNWAALRDFLESYKGLAFRQKIWGSREADDGIALHANMLPYGLAVIAMKDKDSQMITGALHLDWDTYELTEVPAGTYETENSTGRLFGHKWFWLQMLMGDSADHIPGVPQILSHTGRMVQCGNARARDALVMSVGNEDAFMTVSSAYHRYYEAKWPDVFAEQAALLWMRNDKDAKVDGFLQVIPDNERGNAVRAAAERLVARVQEAVDAAPNF